MKYRVSIDIGGTFTDFIIHDLATETAITGKVISTPEDPAEGVMAGLHSLVKDPPSIDFLVHGTTVGLNAFLERGGTRVLIVTTEGFRDVYVIARGDRKRLYDLQYSKPKPLVALSDIHTVRERLRWDGSVQQPLHIEDLEPIIAKIERERIDGVAVCLLHAHVNPMHEVEIRRILLDRAPQLSVSLSHEVAREWREYERTSTVALNAYIAPTIELYLQSLERQLEERGVTVPLHVMQSNGGVMTSAAARRHPIQTLLSGPVGGTIGGKAMSQAIARPNLICVDMGGTSFDVSLVVDGEVTTSTETSLQGLPVLMSVVDIHTVGAGGGSLAWLEAGALRVGPRSAGAEPGPACYGRGGSQPAITDANLYLGRMNSGYFLGGEMKLDYDAAENAIGMVADQLGMGKTALAEGMLAIVNARMADAIRTITVRQGIDPREYSLLAFGGAGPMHAAPLAEELEISEVIVPWAPGTFSAWGMLQSDIRRDLALTYYCSLDDADPDVIEGEFAELEVQGRAALYAEGVPEERMRFVSTADMRYMGQEYFVNVVVPRDQGFAKGALDVLTTAFHDAYKTRYGHSTPGAGIEIVNLRVAAVGLLPGNVAGFRPSRGAEAARDTRPVVFDGALHDARIMRRDLLPIGNAFDGPAVVEERTATTIVPPGWGGRVDDLGNLLLTRADG